MALTPRGQMDALLPDKSIWVAKYPDDSGIYVFPTELEAFRHANGKGMEVSQQAYGTNLVSV